MDETKTVEIIYQDDFIVAIHKPAGLLVHRSNIDAHETENALQQLKALTGKWVYPIHRLDKPTSGILLFAFDGASANALASQFEEGKVEKKYQAVVRGFSPDTLSIDHPLKPIADFKRDKRKTKNREKEAQSALTGLKMLKHYELPFPDRSFPTSRYSLVELTPKTGRKHQLRRHMKHVSHPIIGDPKHGKSEHNRLFDREFNSYRLLLAATSVNFRHPQSKENITLQAPLEYSFQHVIDQLDAHKV